MKTEYPYIKFGLQHGNWEVYNKKTGEHWATVFAEQATPCHWIIAGCVAIEMKKETDAQGHSP